MAENKLADMSTEFANTLRRAACLGAAAKFAQIPTAG